MASSDFSRNINDANFSVTRALPTSNGTVTSTDINIEGGTYNAPENVDLEIVIPALNATQLPNASTLQVTVQGGASASPTAELFRAPVLTGAGGVGAASVTHRFRLPSNCPKFLNVKFVGAGTTGDQSGATATIKLLF